MRKAILLLLTLLAFAVFAFAQTTSAPANQNSPTSSNPNATASPNPSAPQTTMPPDTTPSGTPASSASDQATQNNQSAATSQPASGGDVASSTELRATLDTPLSTKTSKVGDTFTSTLVETVHGLSGQVAIPAGSKIHGEVTEAEEGKT